MLHYDFDQSVGYWLVTAHQAYVRAFKQALSEHGVTFRQAQVLGWLVAKGPQSQRDLAERMLIEPPNLVGVLDRMETAGLVERRPCPDDGRKKLVHLLPGAEAQWQTIAACGRDLRERVAAELSPSDLTRLKKLLDRLAVSVAAPEPADVG